MPKITQAILDRARRDAKPGARAYDVVDTGTGLVLRVGPRGASWSFRAERYGHTVRLRLGTLDTLTLNEARQVAASAMRELRDFRSVVDAAWLQRELVRLGKHAPAPVDTGPSTKEIFDEIARRHLWSFAQARDAYLAEVLRTRREATWHDYKAMLHVPELGPLDETPVAEISRERLARVVGEIHRSSRERHAEHLASVLRPMWTYLARDDVRHDSGVEPRALSGLRAPERSRREEADPDVPGTYVPTVDELGIALAVTRSGALQEVVAAAMELLLMTVQRRRTIVSARRTDFVVEQDGELVWRIPAAHRKTARKRGDGRTHDLPLPAGARAAVERMLAKKTDSAWLFPGYRPRRRGGRVRHINVSVLNHALLAMPGVEASPHDLRRGLTTHGQDVLGLTLPEIKLILDHNEGIRTDDVTESSYSRARRLNAKRAVLDPWAELLESAAAKAMPGLPEVEILRRQIAEARMPKASKPHGSGNVFQDLGLPDAGERLAKADVASKIAAVIEERRLTDEDAARVVGVTGAEISLLIRGQLDDFGEEHLGRILDTLAAA